jgi:hypothetical protein
MNGLAHKTGVYFRAAVQQFDRTFKITLYTMIFQ